MARKTNTIDPTDINVVRAAVKAGKTMGGYMKEHGRTSLPTGLWFKAQLAEDPSLAIKATKGRNGKSFEQAVIEANEQYRLPAVAVFAGISEGQVRKILADAGLNPQYNGRGKRFGRLSSTEQAEQATLQAAKGRRGNSTRRAQSNGSKQAGTTTTGSTRRNRRGSQQQAA
jgi:hypothetical protein